MCARSRERLCSCDPNALSDLELLSLIIGSNLDEHETKLLARKSLAIIDARNTTVTAAELRQVEGMNDARAMLIPAALEFCRRRIRPEGEKITGPEDVPGLVHHLLHRKQETFVVLSLNGAHEVIASRIITIGTVNSCQIHPREVFADVIADRAAAIIAVHNHPSGRCTPSEHDRKVSIQLSKAGEILGIPMLDHIIVTRNAFYSFATSEPSLFCATTRSF